MALLIDINKIEHTDEYVRYKYFIYSSPNEYGVLEVNLQTEEVVEIQQAPNDNEQLLFTRAAMKISKHWKNDKEFPDKTCWAS